MIMASASSNDMDGGQQEQCPICGRLFDLEIINKHVDSCIWLHEKITTVGAATLTTESPTTSTSKQHKHSHSNKKNSPSSSKLSPGQTSMKRKRASTPMKKSFFSPAAVEKKQCTDQCEVLYVSDDSNNNKQQEQQQQNELPTEQLYSSSNTTTTLDSAKISSDTNNSSGSCNNVVTDTSANRNTIAMKSQHNVTDDGPLANKMRPGSLIDFIGQQHVLGEGSGLWTLIQSDDIPSMILWGPPGCGKTTLAHIIGSNLKLRVSSKFVKLSATNSGVADVRKVIQTAQNNKKLLKIKTVLFIDEIHRFNKTQQDTFLPYVENGTITLIGATTENPSFHLNSALLSRCKVYPLEKLTVANLTEIVIGACSHVDVRIVADDGTATPEVCNSNNSLIVTMDTVKTMCELCDGDARIALNGFHTAVTLQRHKRHLSPADMTIDIDTVKESLMKTHLLYDRVGDEHHNCASALQKSIRGSCASASVYWLARMLSAGEDPLFVARRLVVCASEDVGLADPHALPLAVSTMQACQLVGMPECRINLAHCTVYLAQAPKSNIAYMGYNKALKIIQEQKGAQPGVPLHLRNAPTQLSKQLGYGRGYIYTHGPRVNDVQQYLPEGLEDLDFFEE